MRTQVTAIVFAGAGVLQTLLAAAPLPAAQEPKVKSPEEIVLPSQTCRGLFFLAVTVGPGEGTTLHFLLDTGSSWTFVDPRAIRRVLGRDAGTGKVSFERARAGSHELGPLRARLYPMDTLERAVGRKFDGILGFPAFKNVLLTLDYPAEEVRISRGRLPRPDGRKIFAYRGFRRPHLDTEVGGQRMKILLDSGSTGRFSLVSTNRLAWSVVP